MEEFDLTGFLAGDAKGGSGDSAAGVIEAAKEEAQGAVRSQERPGGGRAFDLTKFIRSGAKDDRRFSGVPTYSPDYGVLDRQRDSIIAETGEDVGTGEALARNVLPFVGDDYKTSASAELIQLQKLYDGTALKDVAVRRDAGVEGDAEAGERKSRNMVMDAVNNSSFTGNPGGGASGRLLMSLFGMGDQPKPKTMEETYFDQLENVAKNAGIGREEIEKLRSGSKTVEEFADGLRGVAERELKARVIRRREAQGRMEGNEPSTLGEIANGLITNLGYQGKYMLAGMSGGASLVGVAAQSAEQRATDLMTKDYDVDADGRLVVRDTEDSPGAAVAKGIAGGVAEVAVEQFLEKGLGLAYKGLKRIPGIGAVIGKVGDAVAGTAKKFAGGIGARLSKNPAGKWLVGAAENFSRYSAATGIHGMPMEMGEEYAQDFIDDVLGVNVKGSDYTTLGNELSDWWKNKFLTTQYHSDIFFGLVGTMALQGAYAGTRAHSELKKWRRDRAGFLKTMLDEKAVDSLSDSEVAHLFDFVTSDRFTKENVGRYLGRIKSRLEMTNALLGLSEANAPFFDTNADAVRQAAESGEVKSQFTPPTREAAPGVAQVDWQPYRMADGAVVRRIVDPKTGIAVSDVGGGVFVVTNRDGFKVPVADIDNALKVADKMSIQNQLLDAKRPAKEAYLKRRIAETANGGNITIVPNAAALAEVAPELTRSHGYTPGNPAVTLDDGRVILITDNIRSAEEANRVILHEVAVHAGLKNMFTPDEKRKFLRAVNDPRVEDYKRRIDDRRRRRGLPPVDWSSDEGVEEAFAHGWDGRRADPSLADRVNHALRNLGRSLHLPLSYNANDTEVIVDILQRDMNRPVGRVDDYGFDTGDYARGIPYNEGRRDYSGDVADASAPSARSGSRGDVLAMQRIDRIRAGHPYLWEYAIGKFEGDEDAAVDYCSERLEDEGRRGKSGEMDHAHHALLVADKLKGGRDLAPGDMDILDEHGFTGPVLYRDYGYRRQKDGSWKRVAPRSDAAGSGAKPGPVAARADGGPAVRPAGADAWPSPARPDAGQSVGGNAKDEELRTMSPKRPEVRRSIIDEGRRNIMASQNAKTFSTGKAGVEKIVYTPKDGGAPFSVGRNAFEHSLRGANAEDNAIVGRHIGEALDASVSIEERSENATFRIAPVKVNGADAYVLFTIVDGEMTDFDVLKGFNTKRNPQGMMSEVGGTDTTKAFEVHSGSIANVERIWQERFKPGLVEHARRKGESHKFTASKGEAAAPTEHAEAASDGQAASTPGEQSAASAGDGRGKSVAQRQPKAHAPKGGKVNERKLADAVASFAATAKDGRNPELMKVHHDARTGRVVATNGMVLIATRHGFDSAKAGEVKIPYGAIVGEASKHDLSVRVNPVDLMAVCRKATSLGNASGLVGKDDHAVIALNVGGKRIAISARTLLKFAAAMDAAGLSEIRTDSRTNERLGMFSAGDASTTVVGMPLRYDGDLDDLNGLVLSAEDGRVVSLPSSANLRGAADDADGELKRARTELDGKRKSAVDEIRRTQIHALSTSVREGKLTPAEIVRSITDRKTFADGAARQRAVQHFSDIFGRIAKAGSEEEMDDILLSVFRGERKETDKFLGDAERKVARLEKRAAALKQLRDLLPDGNAGEGRASGAAADGAKESPAPKPESVPPAAQSADGKTEADAPKAAPKDAGGSPLDGYLAGRRPMDAARIRKTLGKMFTHTDHSVGADGKSVITERVESEASLAERAAREGGTLSATCTVSRGGKAKVVYTLGGEFVSKTAADYARHLGVKVDENGIARAGEAVRVKEVQALGMGVGKLDYSASDENVERRLRELVPRESLLRSRPDLAAELRALREIRDARVGRGDWHPGGAEGVAAEVKKPAGADGTIVSGDEVRKTMPGYDRLDWSTHVDRTGYVGPRLEAQFQRLLKERKGKGDGTVVFLAGGNGAGKSTVAAKFGTIPDFVIDSTLGNLEVAKKQIDAILANGQTPDIRFVYRTPGQALEGIKGRVKNGGHIVSPLSFANSHVKSRENLRLLSEAYGDRIHIHIYDNSVPGVPEITLEQLEAKGKPDHAKLREEANYYLGHLRDREATRRDSQGGVAGSRGEASAAENRGTATASTSGNRGAVAAQTGHGAGTRSTPEPAAKPNATTDTIDLSDSLGDLNAMWFSRDMDAEEKGQSEDERTSLRTVGWVNPNLVEDVRAAIAGDADGKPVGRRREVAFSEMPDALKAVGIPDLPIRTRTDIVRKLRRDHGFTERQIVDLPEAYGRPAAVFLDGKAYVVLTGMRVATRGGLEKPVMVVLRESVDRNGRHEFLASAYPREESNENFYGGLARNGKMLFLDKNKVAVIGLNGRTISTLNEQADGNRVKTPEDVSSAASAHIVAQAAASAQVRWSGRDTGAGGEGTSERQTILSGGTSVNQNPAGNVYAERNGIFKRGARNIDIGAGKYDKATQFLAGLGVTNIPFDPVNRDSETNRRSAEAVRRNPADTATVHNVLNVIDSDAVVGGIINQAARGIKKDGVAIFTIYEGDRSGIGKATVRGYQRNAKAKTYIPRIGEYFGQVEAHGNVIVARKPKDVGPAFWAFDSSFDDGVRWFSRGMDAPTAREYDRVQVAPAYANALTFESASEQDAKASVKAWRSERRVFTNEMNGRRAEIKSGWSKIFSTPAKKKSASYEAHYAAANHLDTLFEHGVKMWEEAPRNGSNDIHAYAKYGCPFELNGEAYLAKITVKEYSDRSATDGLYSVESISVEKIGTGGINAGITSLEGHELDPGATVALSGMLTTTDGNIPKNGGGAQGGTHSSARWFSRGMDEGGVGASAAARREYDEVVARYTNPDGTKKPGWMRAPNGRPTNLAERQWVQVRTPAFKAWFGDWEREAVMAGWRDVADAREFVAMPAEDVSSVRPLVGKAAFKAAFAAWGEVTNAADGRRVVFPNASAGKMERVGDVSGALNTLFEKSLHAWSEDDDGRHPNIDGIHHYLAKARTADGEYYVHFTVREDNRKGNAVHAATVSSVEVYKKNAEITPGKDLAKSADEGAEILPGEDLATSTRFVDNKIAYFLGGINPAAVSKVVDENGEPLVVYHGSHSRFTVFDDTGSQPSDELRALELEEGILRGHYFWFSPRREIAERYGPYVRPFFIYKTDAGSAFNGYGEEFKVHQQDELIVYSPEDIKSATDNTGAFDPENPDVRWFDRDMDADGYDREKAAIASAILSDEDIVVEKSFLNMPAKERRTVAKGIYDKLKNGGPVVTRDGRAVRFTGVGFREIKSHSADPHTLAIVPILGEVVTTAHYFGEGEPVVESGREMKYHLYARRVNLGDGSMVARIVLREDVNGNIFYDGESTSIEDIKEILNPVTREPNAGGDSKSPENIRETENPVTREPNAGRESQPSHAPHSIAEFFAGINPSLVAKDVDADGRTDEERQAHNMLLGVRVVRNFASKGGRDFGQFARSVKAVAPGAYARIRNQMPGMWLNAWIGGEKALAIPQADEYERILDSVDAWNAPGRRGESAPGTQERREATAGEKPGEAEGRGEAISAAANEIIDLFRVAATQRKLTRQDIEAAVAKHLGGSVAEGTFGMKDATDIMELAVNRILTGDLFAPTDSPVQKLALIRNILKRVPAQTTRSEEQERMQQFSTPPHEAFAAAWVANIGPGDVVLEPSAGIGGIAVFAKNAGAEVILNELSPRRREILEQLGLSPRVYGFDAEHIWNYLYPLVRRGEMKQPTVVVMNPPFSSSATSGAKGSAEVGGRHVEQALQALAPGGRLVAIVGNGLAHDAGGTKARAWWKRIGARYAVRADIAVDGGEYAKYGTTYGNDIIVIDKVAPDGTRPPVYAKIRSVDELPQLLEGVRNDRKRGEGSGAEVPGPGGQEGRGGGTRDARARGAERLDTRGDERGEPRGGSRGGSPVPDGGKRAQDAGRPGHPGSGGRDGDGRRGHVGGGVRAERHPGVPERRGGLPSDGGLTDAAAVELGAGDGGRPVAREVGNGTFSEYVPSKVSVRGAKPHPTPLVESSAMAAVMPPDPTYRPILPQRAIESGMPSLAQLETVVYAGQAHEQKLPNGWRKGYAIGDGTGVGKGTEISAIISDNWNHGRRKAVWVSENAALQPDAARDLRAFGLEGELFDFDPRKKSSRERVRGIVFSTYGKIANDVAYGSDGEVKSRKRGGLTNRFQELVRWLGKDFDGALVFDEAHNAANATSVRKKRGRTKPSEKALAVVALQKALPEARVVYVSATMATEVHNLAFADRLGLWGRGTAFADKESFIEKVSAGGLSVMEIVARDMKSMGVYLARSLSYEGVGNRKLEHRLTESQRRKYNEFADAWRLVFSRVNDALVSTGRAVDGARSSNVMSALYGAEQRFYNQVLTSMQMPTVLADARRQIDAGNSVVFQLVNTNEAQQDAAAERQRRGGDGEEDAEELDLSPREILISYVEKSFPTVQYVRIDDGDGKYHYGPLVGPDGRDVESPEAVEAKGELLDRLRMMSMDGSPLDAIVEEFGPGNVAEVTGRSRRREWVDDGEGGRTMKFVPRSKARGLAETEEFNAGKRRVLVFSKAGGTGRSFHADRRFKNTQKRVHYLVQAGWRADAALQGFGRTHRSNELQPPEYVLCSTDLRGHQRFITTIARRLAQLGSLTAGDRASAGAGVFSDEDNLETRYATNALHGLFGAMYATDRARFDDVSRQLGFVHPKVDRNTGAVATVNSLVDADGELDLTRLDVPTFLNRILNMRVDDQNALFDEFASAMRDLVEAEKERGTFDPGLERLRGDRIAETRRTELRDGGDGTGKTELVEVVVSKRTRRADFGATRERMERQADGRRSFFAKNINSGKVFGFAALSRTRTLKNGVVLNQLRMYAPDGSTRTVPETDVRLGGERANFRVLGEGAAAGEWKAALDAMPGMTSSTRFFVSGTLLPVWDRIGAENPRIYRIVPTGTGRSFLGMEVKADGVNQILRRFGKAAQSVELSPEAILGRIVREGRTMPLRHAGWELRRAKVNGDFRVELKGPESADELRRLEGDGLGSVERIGFVPRFFIPRTEEGLARFLAEYPAMAEDGGMSGVRGEGTHYADMEESERKVEFIRKWGLLDGELSALRVSGADGFHAERIKDELRTIAATLSTDSLRRFERDNAAADRNDRYSSTHAILGIVRGELAGRGESTGGARWFSRGMDEGGVGASAAARREYDEVVARYTNPDGTRKPGWMRAPNGRPTNLAERQWVQVRTPAFKAWFGDWEKAATLSAIEGMPSVAVETPADGFDAKAAYSALGNGRNAIDGREVRFVNATLGKILRHRGYDTRRLVPRLKEVFDAAIPLGFEAERTMQVRGDGTPHKEHRNFVGYHNYLGKIDDGGKKYFVRFTVQELRTRKKSFVPNEVHSTFVSDVELYSEADLLALDTAKGAGKVGAVGLTDEILAKYLSEFKGARKQSSKVVDENGEPRITDRADGSQVRWSSREMDAPIVTEDILTDEDLIHPSRNVILPRLPNPIDRLIGGSGRPALLKRAILEKNLVSHPEITPRESRRILDLALYHATLGGQSQPKKRQHYWVVVHIGNGRNATVVVDVYPSKENVEVVGWRSVDERGLEKLRRQAEREDGQLLMLAPDKGSAAALSALPHDLPSGAIVAQAAASAQVRWFDREMDADGEGTGRFDDNGFSSIAYRAVNEWRKAYGLPEVGGGKRTSVKSIVREGKYLASNPDEIDRFIRVSGESPSGWTAAETNAVQQRRLQLERDYDEKTALILRAETDGNRSEARQIRKARDGVREAIDALDRANRLAAREWGLTGLARRFLLNRDGTFARFTGEIASDIGRRLSEDEEAGALTLWNAYRDAQGRLDEATVRRTAELLKDILRRRMLREAAEHRTGDAKTLSEIERDYQSALDHLIVHANRAGGVLVNLPDGRRWVDAIRRHHMAAALEVGRKPTVEETVALIAEDLRSAGIVADAHDIMQVITGHGSTYEADNSELEKALREQRALMNEYQKWEDMADEGHLPDRTGFVRDEPTQDLRDARKITQKMMAEFMESHPELLAQNAERRLKTIQDSLMKRWQNEIDDLQKAIDDGERMIRTKGAVRYTPEMEAKKRELDGWRREYREAFPPEPLTHGQKLARYMKALNAQLSRLEAKRSALDSAATDEERERILGRRTGEKFAEREAVELRRRIAEVRADIADIHDMRFPAGTYGEFRARLGTRVKALAANIDRIRTELDTRDFGPKRRVPSPLARRVAQDPEVVRLTARRNAAARRLAQERERYRRSILPYNAGMAVDWFETLMAAPRVLRTMLDLSATLTQGAALFQSHPVLGSRAFVNSVRAFYSEGNADTIAAALAADPDYAEFVEMGGHVYGASSAGEADVPEEFRTSERKILTIRGRRYGLDDIPGVRASERSFGTFLNCLNVSVYRALKSSAGWGPTGPSVTQKRDIALALNVATGRGYENRGGRGAWERIASALLWAPKFAVSGAKMAFGWNILAPHFTGSTAERSYADRRTSSKQAAKEWVRQVVAMSAFTLLTTLLLGRKDPEWLGEMLNPLSANFLSPRIGNTNVSLFGPIRQWWTLVARMVTGRSVGADGVERSRDRGQTAVRFMRGKLSPLAGLAADLVTGKDYVGNDIVWFGGAGDGEVGGWRHAGESLGLPLSASDVYEAFRENSLANALMLTPFIVAGAGKSTYQLDDYARTVNQYRALRRDYDAAMREGRWSDANAMRRKNPILGRASEVASMERRVRGTKRRIDDARRRDGRPDESLMKRLESEKANLVDFIRAHR